MGKQRLSCCRDDLDSSSEAVPPGNGAASSD
jgi:hypothetical protein